VEILHVIESYGASRSNTWKFTKTAIQLNEDLDEIAFQYQDEHGKPLYVPKVPAKKLLLQDSIVSFNNGATVLSVVCAPLL
jgi:hypothetical protein